MNTIIISPYSKKLRDGRPQNPKNYPHWEEVVKLLKEAGYYTIQVGIKGEKEIGADATQMDLPLKQLKDLILRCDSWISVDNFFQHLAYLIGKKGVAIFSQSDPNIFGHDTNINLLKDRSYLRQNQFDIWERCENNDVAFVEPNVVLNAIKQIGG